MKHLNVEVSLKYYFQTIVYRRAHDGVKVVRRRIGQSQMVAAWIRTSNIGIISRLLASVQIEWKYLRQQFESFYNVEKHLK